MKPVKVLRLTPPDVAGAAAGGACAAAGAGPLPLVDAEPPPCVLEVLPGCELFADDPPPVEGLWGCAGAAAIGTANAAAGGCAAGPGALRPGPGFDGSEPPGGLGGGLPPGPAPEPAWVVAVVGEVLVLVVVPGLVGAPASVVVLGSVVVPGMDGVVDEPSVVDGFVVVEFSPVVGSTVAVGFGVWV